MTLSIHFFINISCDSYEFVMVNCCRKKSDVRIRISSNFGTGPVFPHTASDSDRSGKETYKGIFPKKWRIQGNIETSILVDLQT